MKQTRMAGMRRVASRARLHSDEALRQANRAYRQSQPGYREYHGAQRLLDLYRKGFPVDTDKVKAQLQEHEREYDNLRRMAGALQQQLADVSRNAVRLEGAMTALRIVLGDEAPPVPVEMQPSEPAP